MFHRIYLHSPLNLNVVIRVLFTQPCDMDRKNGVIQTNTQSNWIIFSYSIREIPSSCNKIDELKWKEKKHPFFWCCCSVHFFLDRIFFKLFICLFIDTMLFICKHFLWQKWYVHKIQRLFIYFEMCQHSTHFVVEHGNFIMHNTQCLYHSHMGTWMWAKNGMFWIKWHVKADCIPFHILNMFVWYECDFFFAHCHNFR